MDKKTELTQIISKLCVDNRDTLKNKYQLKNINSEKTEYYTKRGIVLGSIGKVHTNITTGPCLLGLGDIERIKQNPKLLDDILSLQPTLQNLISVGYQCDGVIHICMETYEFSKLLENLFNVSFDQTLEIFINIANKIERVIKRLHKNSKGNLHFYYTHEKEIDTNLRQITNRRYKEYLEIMERKKGMKKIKARIEKELKSGKDPNHIFKLRIFSTYSSGWWQENIDWDNQDKINQEDHTIVENIYNINSYIDIELNPNWLALIPVRSLDWKREMAQGRCIYLGNKKELLNAITELKSQIPRKSPHHCNIGNILPYTTSNFNEMDTLLDCYTNGDYDKYRCERCFEKVEDFLLKLFEI